MSPRDRESDELIELYLHKLRRALVGCPSIDATEIERDVRDHIAHELEDSSQPPTAARVAQVLDRLGSPLQWIPESGLNEWQRVAIRLREGPEDWRLAYAALFLFLVALAWPPVALSALLGSFLLARAAVSTVALRGERGGPQRWLLYPPLLAVSIPFGILLLGWPVLAVRYGADALVNLDAAGADLPLGLLGVAERIHDVRLSRSDPFEMSRAVLRSAHFFLVPVGLWLFAFSLWLRPRPHWSLRLLRPFADRLALDLWARLLTASLFAIMAGAVIFLAKQL